MKGRNDLLPSKKASWSPAASPPMTDSEFAKLMLEGGGRPRKGTFPSSIPFFSAKDQKNELPEPMATKAFPGIHPQQGGQVQDDEFAAWLSYPIDDYCSEILSELAGAEAMSAAAAPPLPSKPVQSKESPKPVINFSIFSRPIMESSSSPLKPPESPKIAASVSNPAAMKPDSEVLASSEKNPEPALASSSLCSQNEPKSRRREEDDETEEDQTEDQGEGESTDRRPAKRQATNKKRSRSAEIHNLSERRRRDRINEKMRALQELVPSCNKVDKASMLDEVIEYLKSLQMQLQAMSMGFMRPMMLPNGMPMNMGLGGGMGMVDMTGFPMMPFPAMNGMNGHPHGIHMMMPGHVMPMSMLHSPHFIPMRPPVAGTPIATPANPLQASIPCSEKSKVESFRDV